MSSEIIRHCQSPTEKVSNAWAKMVVIIGLLPYLLTYIFILKKYLLFSDMQSMNWLSKTHNFGIT